MRAKMTPESAETIALQALVHLTQSPDDLGRFLASSGLGPTELKARAHEPELLSAVLDFMLTNEALLVTFCEADSMRAKDVHLARHLLGGS